MTGGGTWAVIVAAGRGARIGSDTPKQFLDLGGRPVLEWSLRVFGEHPDVDDVLVVLEPERAAAPPSWVAPARVAAGGETRAESVRFGLAALPDDVTTVLVHDGARPFVSGALISRVLDAARSGPVIPAVPVVDTIKRVTEDGRVRESLVRSELRAAQTPQGFPRELLARAHREGGSADSATDDALLCERLGIPVRTVEGDAENFKITTEADLARARWLVERGGVGMAGGAD